ncbi:MAG: hypothetical protein ABL916_23015 [Burkholderiaceae bacterium]
MGLTDAPLVIPFKLLRRHAAGSPPDARPPRLENRRAALTDGDRVLLSATHLWLRRIPGRCQPKQLCRHYPRIANAIARHWDDQVLGDRLLTDLLVDRRGNRAGFPPRIVDELQMLRRLRVHARDNAYLTDRLRRTLAGAFGR